LPGYFCWATVAFGGFAAAWQATDKFSLAAQIYAQDKYLQSELEDIGGNSVQATFGGTYFFSNHGISLSFARGISCIRPLAWRKTEGRAAMTRTVHSRFSYSANKR
jgi:hypothetical protein